MAFGSGAMTNPIGEIRNADCIFVIGSNTSENHPVIALQVKAAVRQKKAKLIVADPRRIDPGQREVVVSKSIHERFSQANIGDTMFFGKGSWTVVCLLDRF